MSRTHNQEIWHSRGLGEATHTDADEMMPFFLKAIEINPDIARRVFEEALFQIVTLPTRSKDFQKRASWRQP